MAELAREEGFDLVGIAAPDAIPHAAKGLSAYLKAGHHASMDWMETHAERRASPLNLWPEVRSVIMLGLNYGPTDNPLEGLKERGRGLISVYAQGEDYHEVIKPRLKAMARSLADESGAGVKVFVDTAPLMEKPLAEAAGLGWQGKHTNLVSRDFGSWLFLGAVLTTLEISRDTREADHCGSCQACLVACPTQAFPAPHTIDAGRCISYLTIEHKGPIDPALRPLIGNRIYGCDDCLAVCPWNKFAEAGRTMKLAPVPSRVRPALADLVVMDDAAFRQFFSKSPVKRIGRDRFIRNVLIAMGNSADAALAPLVQERLEDASPLVRGAAVWALSRLVTKEALMALARPDSDADVAWEWKRALETTQ